MPRNQAAVEPYFKSDEPGSPKHVRKRKTSSAAVDVLEKEIYPDERGAKLSWPYTKQIKLKSPSLVFTK